MQVSEKVGGMLLLNSGVEAGGVDQTDAVAEKRIQLPWRELVISKQTGEKFRSVRVLVVDDYAPWRAFLSTTIQTQPELQIVGNASDGLEAVQEALELQPDLVLLDLGLPGLNGIEVARRIREVSPASKILVVSENRSVDIVRKALEASALGYVVKSDGVKELLSGIKAALEGKRFISNSLAGHFALVTLSVGQSLLMLISGIH